MKIFTLWIGFISCVVYSHARKPIGKLTNLGTVTRFEGIENYYQKLQELKPDTPPQESRQPEKNANIKKLICKNICTSDYFDMRQEDWFDVDVRDNRMELKNEYPQIFKSIYKEYRTYCLSFIGDSCYSYRYENNYESLPVSVGASKRDEYVFRCLVRDRRSKRIKPYYVSQEYDVNMIDTYPIAGRFIFTYSRSNDTRGGEELVLHALAEESAVGWDFLGRFIEMYYVSERNTDRPRSSRLNRSSAPVVSTNERSNAFNATKKSNGDSSKYTDPKKPYVGTEINGNSTMKAGKDTENGKSKPADDLYKTRNTSEKRTLDTNKALRTNGGKNTTDTNKLSSTLAWTGPGKDIDIKKPEKDIDIKKPSNITTRSKAPENKDPICQLTAGDKLRLCATIFASSVFKGRAVKFMPTIDNVQLDCERIQVSFNAEVATPPAFMARLTQWEIRESGKRNYEESVIGCRALIKSKNYKMTYLVSQGNYDNSVFVYTHKFSDRRVFLYNYFNNTSVI